MPNQQRSQSKKALLPLATTSDFPAVIFYVDAKSNRILSHEVSTLAGAAAMVAIYQSEEGADDGEE